ncbi:hypothetical protein M408DRAFT_331472 [Serendipita vermifera MAFF 305830]|uniref:WW domain-containing protein n=1 Tax=Serendipita vermifera MAFF 305830 TaxID=933852 RepID=A0A0C3AYC5_SERVB|nr:hypothetical protein M408DRAFT_331472 [Serendipita vermifera MAFF 305830]
MSDVKAQNTSGDEVSDKKSPKEQEIEASKTSSAGAETLDKASSDEDSESGEDTEQKVNSAEEEKKQEDTKGADVTAPAQHDWQAVYSPQYNAYYFYNTKTQETTWTNPLEPQASAPAVPEDAAFGSSAAAVPTQSNPNPALDGIDPELAYLDPNLAAGGPSNPAGMYAARFNARTGRFTATDGRDPSHLSEYERMKRMSSVFFDVGAWEQEVAKRKAQEDADEAEGRRRKKKPTKADLDRYKAQKEARKKTKYAWLRE